MSAKGTNLDWTKLSNIAENVQQPFIDNNNQLRVLISLSGNRWTSQHFSSIIRYAAIKDEWIKIWTLDEPITMMPKSFAIDTKCNIIYIPTAECVYTLEYSRDTPNMKQISIKERNYHLYNSDTRSLVINDQLHIFEFDDCEDARHSTYGSQCWKHFTRFSEFLDSDE